MQGGRASEGCTNAHLPVCRSTRVKGIDLLRRRARVDRGTESFIGARAPVGHLPSWEARGPSGGARDREETEEGEKRSHATGMSPPDCSFTKDEELNAGSERRGSSACSGGGVARHDTTHRSLCHPTHSPPRPPHSRTHPAGANSRSERSSGGEGGPTECVRPQTSRGRRSRLSATPAPRSLPARSLRRCLSVRTWIAACRSWSTR